MKNNITTTDAELISPPLYEFCVNVHGSRCKSFIPLPQVLPAPAKEDEIDFYMQKLKTYFEKEGHKCTLDNRILLVKYCDDPYTGEYTLRNINEKSPRNTQWNFGMIDC